MHEYPKPKNAAIQQTDDTKTRSKRSSDTEYDYYKDTDYYNYYGVENPVRCPVNTELILFQHYLLGTKCTCVERLWLQI